MDRKKTSSSRANNLITSTPVTENMSAMRNITIGKVMLGIYSQGIHVRSLVQQEYCSFRVLLQDRLMQQSETFSIPDIHIGTTYTSLTSMNAHTVTITLNFKKQQIQHGLVYIIFITTLKKLIIIPRSYIYTYIMKKCFLFFNTSICTYLFFCF